MSLYIYIYVYIGGHWFFRYMGAAPPLHVPRPMHALTGKLATGPNMTLTKASNSIQVLTVSVKRTLLQRRIPWGKFAQQTPNRGLVCSSAAVLQGKGSRKRIVFLTDTGMNPTPWDPPPSPGSGAWKACGRLESCHRCITLSRGCSLSCPRRVDGYTLRR